MCDLTDFTFSPSEAKRLDLSTEILELFNRSVITGSGKATKKEISEIHEFYIKYHSELYAYLTKEKDETTIQTLYHDILSSKLEHLDVDDLLDSTVEYLGIEPEASVNIVRNVVA